MAEKPSGIPTALVSEAKPGKQTETSLVRRKTVVIGRSSDCDVVIKDPKASRHHCRLTRSESGLILEDLNSKNGTFVDGQRIKAPVTLKTSHAFKVGDTVFYLT